jgi:hypothetical protein
MYGKVQQQKYASFSCRAYRLLSKHGPPRTVHMLHRSTSLTMIRFFTYFISLDRPSSMETRKISHIDLEGKDGNENDGGINSHMFAKDGETLYLRQHPT